MIRETQPKNELALANLDGKVKAPAAEEIKTFEDVVDFAIREETKAYVSYMALAGQSKYPRTRKAFEEFASEEVAHIDRLVEMKKAGRFYFKPEDVPDLRFEEYITAEVLTRGDMDTREAYIFAMRAEEAAANLYRDLAAQAVVPEIQELLLALAQEEAKHKLKLETEYEDHVLAQN